MLYKTEMTGLTNVGKVREMNEDDLYIDPSHGIMIIADGMGGHLGGEVASKIVVKTISQRLCGLNPETLSVAGAGAALETAIQAASDTVKKQGQENLNLKGMGSTTVISILAGSEMILACVGDSRAYLWRNGDLCLLTSDQNFAGALYEAGLIDTQERGKHPGRHTLLQYMGMEDTVIPDYFQITVQPDDRILLCTDGLSEMLSADEIAAALALPDLNEAGQTLITGANNAGGRDNITVAIADIHPPDENAGGSTVRYPKVIPKKIIGESDHGGEKYEEKK